MVAQRGDAPAKNGDGGTARGCAGEKWAMGCASLDRQRWHGEGMRRPKRAMVARRGDAPAKKSDHQIGGLAANAPANEETKSAGNAPAKWNNAKSVAARWGMRRQTKQHQIGGSAANAPANEATPNRWIGGECAGKRSNTTSVDRRRMRRQTKQHQIGGSAANAPANEATPNRWIGGECAGKRRDSGTTMGCAGRTKRMRRGDEMRRPNEKRKARRWMHDRTRNGGAVMECTGRTKKRRCADGMRRPNKETAAR
jgi:hypothetical protein